jgi:hypothetical protein
MHELQVTEPPSGFLTMSSDFALLPPLCLALIVSEVFALSSLALTKPVDSTVMPGPKEAVAPETKFCL